MLQASKRVNYYKNNSGFAIFAKTYRKQIFMTPEIIIIIASVLPILVVLIAVYLMLKYFSKQNEKQFDFLKANQDLTRLKLENDRSKDRERVLIPLRLQACERVVLFLERINPPNLLTREMMAGVSVEVLQLALLKAVREEYEHNMSQQLYVSDQNWEHVKAAKEKIVQLVNASSSKLNAQDSAIQLANEILTSGFDVNNDPVERAMKAIKSEIKNNN